MLFDSVEYLLFLPLVALLYFMLPARVIWVMLLGASYYFYMSWKPMYAVFMVCATVISFSAGIAIENAKSDGWKKLFLVVSILLIGGMLFVLKYFNFAMDNLRLLFPQMGSGAPGPFMRLLLPVGISFYTFQAIAYTVDVFRGGIRAERHLGRFALFISFFPQLVAGPIERFSDLAGQLARKNSFSFAKASEGVLLVGWGLFKKVVIADRLALVVNPVFNDPSAYSGFSFVVATVFFTFQVYADFSAYSDIAVGSARILGIDLTRNFRLPFMATTLSDFWRNWHVSLSNWIREYLYMPLAIRFRYWGTGGVIFALITSFTICGIWHGANWTFVVFGLIQGAVIAVETLTGGLRKSFLSRVPPAIIRLAGVLYVFAVWGFSNVFFRSKNISDALHILKSIALETRLGEVLTSPAFHLVKRNDLVLCLGGIALLFGVQILEHKTDPWTLLRKLPFALRGLLYSLLFWSILLLWRYGEQGFIYFVF